MKKLESNILIDASPETIWRVLTDFENYPAWNPFIKLIAGEKEVGKSLNISIKPPGSNGMSFKPVILKFEPSKELRWKGKLGMKGIFDGEHYFILQRNGKNATNFIQGEVFSGILVWMLGSTLDKTEEGFNLMNRALKEQCEKKKTIINNLV
ncbi:MAG: Polyketide cyclase/dehydrase [Adhaeribacter sp.]|nr:Polyketide cyclase/dehydrase [Adhaeribacter sp.]